MKATVNKGVVSLAGKPTDEDRMLSIVGIMAKEIESLVLMENLAGEIVEMNLCYDAGEATVQTVKDSYADAKKTNL